MQIFYSKASKTEMYYFLPDITQQSLQNVESLAKKRQSANFVLHCLPRDASCVTNQWPENLPEVATHTVIFWVQTLYKIPQTKNPLNNDKTKQPHTKRKSPQFTQVILLRHQIKVNPHNSFK